MTAITLPQFSDSPFIAFSQQSLEPDLLVKDDAFDINKISDYTLCIEIGADRFRFIVTQPSGLCLWLEDYSFKSLVSRPQLMTSITKLYDQHPFLENNTWKNVSVSFNTPQFTLVPNDFFRKEYTVNYLHLMRGNGLQTDEIALSNGIDSIDARNTFVGIKSVYEWVLSTYSLHTPTFTHQTSTLIGGALKNAKKDKPEAVFYFEDDYVTIVVCQNQKLLFCNKFRYSIAQDMGYYVLLAITNLKIRPADISCVLYGEITPYAENYQWLQKFLPNMSLGQGSQSVRLGEAFDDLPEHRYFSLYGIYSA